MAWRLGDNRLDPVAAHRAAALAKEAIEFAPQDVRLWQTLGLAHYRARQWEEAIAALKKVMELDRDERRGALSMFLLAMSHWRLGNKEEARKWYDRAAAWVDKHQPKDGGEIGRFRREGGRMNDQKVLVHQLEKGRKGGIMIGSDQ